MAAAIRNALKHGPGDEYAWRGLSWALHHAGQWQDSLGLAHENVLRNSVSGWSLQQREPFDIRATVTIRSTALGPVVLAGLPPGNAPDAFRGCLGPFQHGGETFDPAAPLVSRIAGRCRSPTDRLFPSVPFVPRCFLFRFCSG